MPKTVQSAAPELKRDSGARKRGRPARLSRQDILQAALELLVNEPAEHITMAKVAAALDTGPMTLYNHVKNKEDLLDGVSRLAFEQLTLKVPTDQPWQQQLRYWMSAVRQHFIRFPQLIKVLGWRRHISAGWLEVMAAAVDILHAAGLRDTVLARASQWLGRSLVSTLMIEISSQVNDGPHRLEKEDFARLTDVDTQNFEAIREFIAVDDPQDLFNYHIDRVVASVEQLLVGA